MGLKKSVRVDMENDILISIEYHPKDIIRFISEKHNISRQTINNYMNKYIEKNIIERTGKGKNTIYKLKDLFKKSFVFKVSEMKDEDFIWREYIYKELKIYLSDNIKDICHYGFTEMLNNVIDHSGAENVTIFISLNLTKIYFSIKDDGIGIFRKIQNDFGLESPSHSIFELSKGKLTSDALNHSGEGIFFTSRIFDKFEIISDNLFFSGHNKNDWIMESNYLNVKGTNIFMEISMFSSKDLNSFFDKFMHGDDYSFCKTFISMKLLENEGSSLISRSQAKRLVNRLEKFRFIYLDFEDIKVIGQSFADELFRVFRNNNPKIELHVVNANKKIDTMIKHVTQ